MRLPPDARRSRFAGALIFALASTAAPLPAAACRDTLAPLIEQVVDTVVNISTTQTLKGLQGLPLPRVPKGSPFEKFFNDFLDKSPGSRKPRRANALGAGFVIDPSGLIVTNNHVIADADEIVVNFNDGTKLTVVEVVGRDAKTDIALLRVKPEKPLAAARFGDSARLRVGDCVIAIGNPFGLGISVTSGIVSAKKRDINAGLYDEFIQTDAAINKGNSGGPLFNLDREVVGMNTAIISPSGRSVGIGFAAPSNVISLVVGQLRAHGAVRRGWIGVQIQSVSEEISPSLGLDKPRGALVSGVSKSGPAAAAGLEVGDVILRFDGKSVDTMRGLPRIVARTPVGKSVTVEVLRNGKSLTLSLTVAQLKKSASAKPKAKSDAKGGTGAGEGAGPGRKLLGLTLVRLTAELRKKFKVGADIHGAIITAVEPGSPAAKEKIAPGDVVVEVAQEEVDGPGDVADRLEELRELGKKVVVLVINRGKGQLRFVNLPMGGPR